jgi:hypothetical protein
MIRIYSGSKTLNITTAERSQLQGLIKILYEEFNRSKDHIYLLIDYILGNKQIDILLIKKNAIILVDLKGYSGIVHGYEDGQWYVETDQSDITIDQDSNPFVQVRNQRYDMIKFLREKLPSIDQRFSEGIRNIAGWVYFNENTSFDIGQINIKNRLWFKVVNPLNILEEIKNEDSNEFIFRDQELENLAQIFGGVEFDIKKIGIYEKQKESTLKILPIEGKYDLPNIEELEKKYNIIPGFLKEIITLEEEHVYQPKRYSVLKDFEELISHYAGD